MIGGESPTLCVILGGGRGKRLFPLTRERAKPAVPLGGKYRLIDVPISNCLNSGFKQIYVITQFQSESLHRHVKSTYRFDNFSHGFVEILAAQQRMESDAWYQGTADAVRQNLVHLQDQTTDQTLILSGDQLYRMNFRDLLDHHRRTEADVTIAALPVPGEACPGLGILNVDETGRIVEFVEKPSYTRLPGLETDEALFKQFGIDAPGRPYLASMGIYVFNTDTLYEELRNKKYADFGGEMFPVLIRERKLQAYLFDDYWEDIGTVKSFHEANLELAKSPPKFQFHSDTGPIFTRSRMLPPTTSGSLKTRDTIIAEGCILGKLEAENSVFGIRSIVGDGVKISRTYVMGADSYESAADKRRNSRLGRPNIGIGDRTVIENAIVDKDARIGADVFLHGGPGMADVEESAYAVKDGVLCIYKGAVIPSGTRIGG